MKKEILVGGGCFWWTEAYYKQIKGVIATEVGYANGSSDTTTYDQVCNDSGHVEVLRLIFDNDPLTTQELFDSYIRIIEPFSKNRQGRDIGVQYRIGLYTNDRSLRDELDIAVKAWEKVNGKSQIELLPINNYVKTEENHQEYLLKNPKWYCHINLSNVPEGLKK